MINNKMALESLKNKTIKGVAWSSIDNVMQYAVSFVVGVILARLLSPDDYGLIGIIGIFTAICSTIINGGFGNALIRKQDATEEDYNTVFIINIGVSIILYGVIFLCAPIIAQFFERQELTGLTRVTSLSIIIGALALVQQTILTKRIDFKTQTRITVISSVTSGVIGIIMAFAGCGVWALVFQGLLSQTMQTILLWVFNKWYPNFCFSKDSFKDLFGYSWKLTVSWLLDTIWRQIYQIVVGKFYSPSALGQYTRANGFAQLFSSNLTNVLTRVSFPVLSALQGDTERMVSGYRKMIKVSMLLSTGGLFLLGAVSEPLLFSLIGAKWYDATVYLPLICISSTLYPLAAYNLNMLQVLGRSDLFLFLEIWKKTIAIIPILVGIFIGIIPMLISSIFISVLCFFINSYYTGELLNYSSWMQIKDVLPSYGVSFVMAVCVWPMKFLMDNYWIILPMQLTLGLVLFVGICKSFKMSEYTEIINIIKHNILKDNND